MSNAPQHSGEPSGWQQDPGGEGEQEAYAQATATAQPSTSYHDGLAQGPSQRVGASSVPFNYVHGGSVPDMTMYEQQMPMHAQRQYQYQPPQYFHQPPAHQTQFSHQARASMQDAQPPPLLFPHGFNAQPGPRLGHQMNAGHPYPNPALYAAVQGGMTSPYMHQGMPAVPYAPPSPVAVAGHAPRPSQRRSLGGAQEAMSRMAINNTAMQTGRGGYPPFMRAMEGSLATGQNSGGEQVTQTANKGPSSLPMKPEFGSPSLSDSQQLSSEGTDVAGARKAPYNPINIRRDLVSVTPPAVPTVPLLSRLPALPPLPDSSKLDAKQLETAFKEREEALILRIEALGFETGSAWKVMKEIEGEGVTRNDEEEEDRASAREAATPVLGIRLLQRLNALQRENDELGLLLEARADAEQPKTAGQITRLEAEIRDAHELIDQLDRALSTCTARAEAAEAKVASQERALAIACAQNSSSMIGRT